MVNCDSCGKKDVKLPDGMNVVILNSKKTNYFICDDCLNTDKTIEEIIIEIDNKLKLEDDLSANPKYKGR